MEHVILVDQEDNPVGLEEKQKAHVAGVLHRAFSVYVLNSKGELLLQQRAEKKYHSPLLWANTCCSHQRYGEETLAAAHRRLQEELGFACELTQVDAFVYKADVGGGLTEHEFLHVLVGVTDEVPKPNAEEVASIAYKDVAFLLNDIQQHPNKYCAWFRIVLPKVAEKLNL